MTLENLLKKQRQQLFISPFKRIRDSSPLYQEEDENPNEKPIFNKETMMYKTHEIKSEMLKECKKIAPALFKKAGPDCVYGKCGEGKMSCKHPRKEDEFE